MNARNATLRGPDIKLLNAVIVGVHDVQFPVAVERHAVGSQELARLFSLFTEAAQITSIARELLDSASGGADPQAVFAVAADGDRAVHLPDGLEVPAEAAGAILKRAEAQEEGTVGREFLDPAVHGFGRVDVAPLVERDEIRAAGPRPGIGIAAELAGLRSVLPPGKEEPAVGVEHLHAVVGLIGDIDAAVRGDRQAAGVIEFTGVRRRFSPTRGEACRRERKP